MAPPQAEQQAARNAAITALALAELRRLWPRVDWASPAAVGAVKLIYRAVVTRYGRATASVGAEFYDDVRAEQRFTSEFRAVPSDPVPQIVTDKAVESAFKGVRVTEVDDDDADGDHVRVTEVSTTSELPVDHRVQVRLEESVGRHVLQPGRDTIAENAANDPAKPVWIRVPTGAKTCPFCKMLASRELGPNFRGYASERNALFRENGEKYHKNCDCVAMAVYPGDDPHEISPNMTDYQRLYNKATANAGTHRDTKKILAEMRKLVKTEAPDEPAKSRRTSEPSGGGGRSLRKDAEDRPQPAAAGGGGRGGGGDDGGNGNNGGMPAHGGDDHPDLTPEERAAARAAARAKLDQARELEPEISDAVRAVVEDNGGELARFDSRVKTEGSLYRKVQDAMVMFDLDPDAAAGRIRDAIRYTAVLPDDGYWAAGTRISEAFEEAGYAPVKRTTGWSREGYRGRNDTFRTADGMEFEVQFHTAASLSAAETSHGLYEEARLPTTSPERRSELDAQQAAIFAAVPIPDDVPLD